MEKKFEMLDKIIEYGIYLYIFFMFLAKGEGIRNILIFGNLGLWLLTLKYRLNLSLLKHPASIWCWIYLSLIPLAVIFSIDPLYSLKEIKNEPLKFAAIFPVIATVLNDKVRLKNAVYVCSFTMLFIVSFGYYSYIVYDIPFLKPHTVLVHAYHNRFAGYINTFLPFAFVLYLLAQKKAHKMLLIAALIFSAVALVLSTSRGGYLAFAGIAFVWALYISRIKKYSFRKVSAFLIIIFTLVVALSYVYSPGVKARINLLSTQLFTLNERTELWGAAYHAFLDRPVYGWGYGELIYHRDEPFMATPDKEAPVKGVHNTYLTLLFHQGLVGFIPFVMFIITAIVTFWKEALNASGFESFLLVAVASVFMGNYILHAQLESMFFLQHVAVVFGLGLAAKNLKSEDSHN
jgi:putative inorganic carbon (HCO3(-)) transporter